MSFVGTIASTVGERSKSRSSAKGITVPFPDALIATIAIDNDLELWNYERHFADMQKVLPALKLFQEPP